MQPRPHLTNGLQPTTLHLQGTRIRIGVVVPIPDEAGGLGDIQINVNANSTANEQVFCLQLSLTL